MNALLILNYFCILYIIIVSGPCQDAFGRMPLFVCWDNKLKKNDISLKKSLFFEIDRKANSKSSLMYNDNSILTL